MKFNKPPKRFEEQLDLLIARGMSVQDQDQAIHFLSHINYYRLEAYWLPFEASRDPHQFRQGTQFETIRDHYTFDRELRLLVLDAIERLEVSFRTQWAYHISHAYGPHGFMANTQGMRKNERRLRNDLEDLSAHLQRSDEVFIKHYRENYDEPLPPAWVSCEVMSLGLFSRLYSNLRAFTVRRAIADTYKLDEGFLEGFLEHLTYVRNVCAHHNRLWNRHLSKKMPLPKGKPAGLKDNIYIDDANKTEHKIYNTLVMIAYLMSVICPDSEWTTRLDELLHKYPMIDIKRMGFPLHWKTLPLWAGILDRPPTDNQEEKS